MWHVDLLRNGGHEVRGSLGTRNSDSADKLTRCLGDVVDFVVTYPPYDSCRDILALRQSGRGTTEMQRKLWFSRLPVAPELRA